MKKPVALLALALAALPLAGCAPTGTQVTTRTAIAAVGDSLSAASNSCGKNLACYSNSWSTGSNKVVDSLAQRLNSAAGKKYETQNYAVLGTKLDGMTDQMLKAINYKPEYLSVLIGANDFCTPSAAEMTSTTSFTHDFQQLVSAVAERSPGTHLIVASVPNPETIYEAGRDNPAALAKWRSGSICQSMLADPSDQSAQAIERRQEVVSRAGAFNEILKTTCAKYDHCSYDGGAVGALKFTAADISTVDYFHLSTSGQQKVAATVWENAVVATLP